MSRAWSAGLGRLRRKNTHPQGTDDASPSWARTISARRTTKPPKSHLPLVSRAWVIQARHEKTRPSPPRQVREECQRVHQAEFLYVIREGGRGRRAGRRPQRKGDRRSPRPAARLWGFWPAARVPCIFARVILRAPSRLAWFVGYICGGGWVGGRFWPGKTKAGKWRETSRSLVTSHVGATRCDAPAPAVCLSRARTDQRISKRTMARRTCIA